MALKPKLKKIRINRQLVLLAIMAILVLAVGSVWAVHRFKKTTSTIPSTTPSHTSSTSQNTNPPSSSGSSGNSGLTDSSKPPPTSSLGGAALIAPFGSFVSNHHPTTSGTPGPNEQSVCNTTPGATCYIEFAQGGTIRRLAAQTVDSSGSTYWNWNINDAQITSGSWTITAVASLNGKTLTDKDSMTLDVQ